MATVSKSGSQSNAVPSSSVPPPDSSSSQSSSVAAGIGGGIAASPQVSLSYSCIYNMCCRLVKECDNSVICQHDYDCNSSPSHPSPHSLFLQPTLGINTSSHTLPVVSYISAGVSGAVVVLVAAAVTVISASVCLRKRKNKHVNTTDNVAYHCSNSRDQETMKLKEAYAELSGPSITTSTNDAYGITGGASDVTTSQNEAYAVTDGACQSSGSGMKMKTNEAYTDMSSAMNEDAYTYVTQRTTAVLTATNAAHNALTSTDEVYNYPNSPTAGNDIATSSNEAYGITQQVNAISITHATDEVHDMTEYI